MGCWSRPRVVGLVLAALLLAASWVALRPATVFTVRLPLKNHRLVAAVPTRAGTMVRLSYRHSVEKTPVEGRFVVGEGPWLHIRETRMASVGTGLPNAYPQRTRREGSWLVVDEGDRKLEGLSYRLMQLNRTRLFVGGAPVFLDHIRSGALLRMDVEHTRWGRWLLWRLTDVDWRQEPIE
jgi:hypothetical protein